LNCYPPISGARGPLGYLPTPLGDIPYVPSFKGFFIYDRFVLVFFLFYCFSAIPAFYTTLLLFSLEHHCLLFLLLFFVCGRISRLWATSTHHLLCFVPPPTYPMACLFPPLHVSITPIFTDSRYPVWPFCLPSLFSARVFDFLLKKQLQVEPDSFLTPSPPPPPETTD